MMARQVELVIRRVGHPERRLVLEPGQFTIGRADDNDIVLSEVGVSRRHARILVDAGGVLVEDNGSGNGTLFEGKRVQRQAVEDEDEITIYPFRLAFRLRGPPEPVAELTDGAVGPGEHATQQLGDTSTPTSARLELVSDHPMAQEVFNLPDEGVVTMGRSERNGIVLPEPAASRVHAEVGGSHGDFWLRDHGSSNGTLVNGRRVKEKVLEDGDVIRIGTVELRFMRNPDAEPGEHTEAFDGVMFTSPGPPPRIGGPPPAPRASVLRSPAPRAVAPGKGIHPLAIAGLAVGCLVAAAFAVVVVAAVLLFVFAAS